MIANNQQNEKFIEDCANTIIKTINKLIKEKQITREQYNKLSTNIAFIISKYAIYHKNGISIPAKVLINNFLED